MYCFVCIYKNTKDVEQILTSSLVIGYIICQIALLIPISYGSIIDSICIVFCSIMSGFLLGEIKNSKGIRQFINRFKIRRTANSYYWNDLLDRDKIMKGYITINNKTYSGKVHLIEEFSNSPHIVLAEYSVDGEKNDNDNQIIILDTLQAAEVIIEYDKDSPMLETIKFYE